MTELQKKILKLFKKGFSKAEIARRLNCSRKHVINTIKKFSPPENEENQENFPFEEEKTAEEQAKEEIQIEKERLKRKAVEERYKALKTTLARDENIINALKTVIPNFPTPEVIIPPKALTIRGKETAVLLLSDWHIGEYVSTEETAGLGEFNSSIATARVELIVEKTINILSNYSLSKIDRLVIGALGDMISGVIHEELEKTQDLNTAEQIIFTAYLLSNLLSELSAYFEIEFVGVVGNHGRLKKQREAKQKYVNWDYIIYQLTSFMLKDNRRINWHISKSPHAVVEIEGHTYLFTHGDTVRSWGGIPFYGISRFANNWREVLNKKQIILDGVCMGHFHQPATMERVNGPQIINGSLKGPDEYSLQFGAALPACQVLFGVSKNYAKTFEFPLWLEEKKEPTRWDIYIPDIWADLKI